MSLLKQRLELKKKLEGKLTEDTPVKKEPKSVSKLVIPQKFTFSTFNLNNNPEEKPKYLNTSISKSTGNLSSSNSTRKLSASLFKSNSIQIEDKPEVLSRVSSERRLSSKSFNIHSPTENLSFDDLKIKSRPKSFVDDSSKSSKTFSVFFDSSSQTNVDAADSTDIPIIVGSIRKNSLPDNPTTPDELKETVHFVRSPKPSKKEETSTILHFNFAAKPDAITKQIHSQKLHKIPSLNRRGSRHAILVPEVENVDGVIKHTSREDSENVDFATKHTPKEENVVNENFEKYNSNIENIPADFTNTTTKKSDEKQEEIYVNIDIIRRYYDRTTRIKCGPIEKNPVPSIRYSLIRKLTRRI